ncbi:replication initiator protein [Sigmofec virus UA08Rod_4343]|uniref:Replication initiator protein n=1 Tax=Sigmofec virus UA08Rod_4343 TaxID=2929400 RepID=A0A976R8N1_9VIRU|nr:replication initiator protein [Sigmofec virus UA08Rod_4343]
MSCNNPFYIPSITNYFGEIIPLPCGCCLQCRIDKRSLWEMRLKSEWRNSRSAFVALTYDDFHMPYGSDGLRPSLNRNDVHKFLDALRHKVKYLLKNVDENAKNVIGKGISANFKYFCVGEYGSDNNRPHYHIIFFGLDFQQAEKLIKTSWKKGFADVKPLKTGGIRYVLKYIDKGLSAGRVRTMMYDRFCIERPKIMASKGIGVDYFLENIDTIRKTGCVKVGAKYVNIPVYYRNKYLDYSAQGIHDFLSFQVQRKKELAHEAHLHGYKNPADYLDNLRVQKEQSLYAKARREGTVLERDSEFNDDATKLILRRLKAYRQKYFNDKYFLTHPQKYMMQNLLKMKKYGL